MSVFFHPTKDISVFTVLASMGSLTLLSLSAITAT